MSATTRSFYAPRTKRSLNRSCDSDKGVVPQPKFSHTLTSFKASTPKTPEQEQTPVF